MVLNRLCWLQATIKTKATCGQPFLHVGDCVPQSLFMLFECVLAEAGATDFELFHVAWHLTAEVLIDIELGEVLA